MLIEKVNATGPQTLEWSVCHLADMLGPTVRREMRRPDFETELGGDRSGPFRLQLHALCIVIRPFLSSRPPSALVPNTTNWCA